MKYQIVDIGRDYPGKIDDFAKVRNIFLEELSSNDQYILYKDSDVEAPKMLLDYLDKLKPEYPWYDIRQINLIENRYQPLQNPFYSGVLVSRCCTWVGRVHEKVYPRNPHGRIDIPLIHNHKGPTLYSQRAPPKILLLLKKVWEVARDQNVKYDRFEQWMKERVAERDV